MNVITWPVASKAREPVTGPVCWPTSVTLGFTGVPASLAPKTWIALVVIGLLKFILKPVLVCASTPISVGGVIVNLPSSGSLAKVVGAGLKAGVPSLSSVLVVVVDPGVVMDGRRSMTVSPGCAWGLIRKSIVSTLPPAALM